MTGEKESCLFVKVKFGPSPRLGRNPEATPLGPSARLGRQHQCLHGRRGHRGDSGDGVSGVSRIQKGRALVLPGGRGEVSHWHSEGSPEAVSTGNQGPLSRGKGRGGRKSESWHTDAG